VAYAVDMAVSVPRYTVNDLERFPDDGTRYELLGGFLLVTPAPRLAHQAVAARLTTLLTLALGLAGPGIVVGHGAVQRLPMTELQPDVLVIPSRFGLMSKWSEITEHWLAVEILSPASRVYDRDFKRAAYFTLGVKEVWLVDLDDRSVDVWTSPEHHTIVRDIIGWRTPEREIPVEVVLAEVFAGLG
jgi:Uma2 family endonuclease